VPAKPKKLAIVLLAAGQSKRFGDNKQLALVENVSGSAQPLMLCVLEQLLESKASLADNCEVIVALAPNQPKITQLLSPNTKLLVCPDSHLGMGHTIQNVIYQIENLKHDITHVMLVLADQVALDTKHFNQVLTTWQNNPDKLIAANTSTGMTAPAIFPAFCFEALKKLEGDKGAKSVLKQFQTSLVLVNLPEAAIDIDTQLDLTQWNSQIIKREQA